MREARRGRVLRGVSFASLATVVSVGFLPDFESADAQVRNGVYWLTQPHQTTRVGRVWCNPGRTVEFWVYVQGEYRWADVGNDAANPWHLSAVRGEDVLYASFEEFQAVSRALPEFQGKTLVFQNHSVSESVIQN